MAWLIKWDEHNQPYPELATAGADANERRRQQGRPDDHVSSAQRREVVGRRAVQCRRRRVQHGGREQSGQQRGRRGSTRSSRSTSPTSTRSSSISRSRTRSSTAAFFSSCCANPSLLPKHLLAQYPNINNVPYNALPVGIGPFKFERWDRSKQVVLVANPLYWRGRPKLDKIVYKIVPDRDALLAQLAAHEVDMWYQFSGAYLARIQALPGVHRLPPAELRLQPLRLQPHASGRRRPARASGAAARAQPAGARRQGRARRRRRAGLGDSR